MKCGLKLLLLHDCTTFCVVFIEYQRVIDGRTDERTDRHAGYGYYSISRIVS